MDLPNIRTRTSPTPSKFPCVPPQPLPPYLPTPERGIVYMHFLAIFIIYVSLLHKYVSLSIILFGLLIENLNTNNFLLYEDLCDLLFSLNFMFLRFIPAFY